MKKLMTVAMLALLAPFAQANDNNQVGRYQLVTADVDHSGNQTLFKIDTVTGQAWTYTEAQILEDYPDPEHPPKGLISSRFWSSIKLIHAPIRSQA